MENQYSSSCHMKQTAAFVTHCSQLCIINIFSVLGLVDEMSNVIEHSGRPHVPVSLY